MISLENADFLRLDISMCFEDRRHLEAFPNMIKYGIFSNIKMSVFKNWSKAAKCDNIDT